jgi:hypothetical protein
MTEFEFFGIGVLIALVLIQHDVSSRPTTHGLRRARKPFIGNRSEPMLCLMLYLRDFLSRYQNGRGASSSSRQITTRCSFSLHKP